MTDREYLIETRKEIILTKMEGLSGHQKHRAERAIRDLGRMNFTDHDDFMSYVSDLTTSDSGGSNLKQATDEEIDAAMSHLFPGQTKYVTPYKPGPGEATSEEIEKIFNNMNL